ncbi:oxygenase MpaB family protein [Paenibacillus sp. V4I7]|uniref:oxygenase MpaB family protein n=1 Tax=Paenibacillus sp. V4I7 TaxID=3042307 RepID=UPI0027872153|nr:oxygenase MpaB family protein [Paenibacillus sp. V4I7]MDQ0897636.1 hypothetical protein [Paenibacillus sp. V4I7]
MLILDQILEKSRAEGNPVPDQIVAELIHTGQMDAVNQLLRNLVHNDQAIPPTLPDNIEDWLRNNASLPDWVDLGRIDRASDFFMKNGVAISLILATAALVQCYAGIKGVKTLTYTYRLGQNPYQRIAETGQFVILAISPGGLTAGGKGIKAIHKVRFIHAAVRHLISRTGKWAEHELGEPICQEDLLGTLMSFSYVVIHSLRMLGIHVSMQEAEDYIYFWRVVGEELGIRPDIIPETMAEAQAVTESIARRHHGPSREGVHMTKALIDMHVNLIPGERFDGIIPALIRHLVGDQIADWMEVPKTNWGFVMKKNFLLTGILESSVINKLGMSLLNKEVFNISGYNRAPFEIPTQLQEAWQLQALHLGTHGGIA